MWRGKILSTCLECEWGAVNSRRSGRKRKITCPVICFQDCEPTRRSGARQPGGRGPRDKSPCCGTSLAVLLVNNAGNFIYTYIDAILRFPSPWPLLTGAWAGVPGSCTVMWGCRKGITYSSLAISLGQSVKWSWRLFLLSWCTSSISPPFPLPPKLQAEPVGIDS